MRITSYYSSLDICRFWAFMAVFFYHAFYSTHEAVAHHEAFIWINEFFSFGYIGVNFFFILSGFIITHSLQSDHYSIPSIGNFILRRLARIAPIYYIALMIGFFIIPAVSQWVGDPRVETASPAFMFGFLPNFNTILNGKPDSNLLGVLWSVGNEMQFYLLWPLLLPLFRKSPVVLTSSVIAGSLVFRYFYMEDPNPQYYFHPLSTMSDFALGALSYVIMRTSSIKFGAKTLAIGLFCLSLAIAFRHQYYDYPVLLLIKRLILGLPIALVIMSMSRMVFGQSRIKFLGKISYGLYIYHTLGIWAARFLLKGQGDKLVSVLVFETVLALCLTVIMAWLSFKLIENPIVGWARKRWSHV